VKSFFKSSLVVLLALLLQACAGPSLTLKDNDIRLSDPNASQLTQALFAKLGRVAEKGFLFGQQDALAYGIDWQENEDRSDIKDLVGVHPAMIGFDLGGLGKGSKNLDGVDFSQMQKDIIHTFESGGVVTLSWHMENVRTGGSSWDLIETVHELLPGEQLHERYKEKLDDFALFVRELKSGGFGPFTDGELIPIIFRPFHESSGSWFWWGKKWCSKEDFVSLWQFTVDYLRQDHQLNNLIFAFSTDIFEDKEDYLDRWPGDEHVDILGFDDYHTLKTPKGVDRLAARFRDVVEIAEEKGKLAAFTETGLEGIPVTNWWTEGLLKAIAADDVGTRIAYVHVWRNAQRFLKKGHYFGPYRGQVSEEDFREFFRNPMSYFMDGSIDFYSLDK